MQLGLAHGTLEPKQEPVIKKGWMINAVGIADERVSKAAEVNETVPISIVSRKA